jgi:hypothetical protein
LRHGRIGFLATLVMDIVGECGKLEGVHFCLQRHRFL